MLWAFLIFTGFFGQGGLKDEFIWGFGNYFSSFYPGHYKGRPDFLFLLFNVFYYLTKVNWFSSCVFGEFSLYNSISTRILRRQPEVTSEVCFETPVCTCFKAAWLKEIFEYLRIFNYRLLKTKTHVWFADS